MKYTLKDVAEAVALKFSIDMDLLLSDARYRKVARPRQIAMFLAREFTTASLPRIGQHFDRDHTTVLHACRNVASLVLSDADVAADVAVCRAIVSGRGSWMDRHKASLDRQRAAETAEDAAEAANDGGMQEVA